MGGDKMEGERIRSLWKQVQCLKKSLKEESSKGVDSIDSLTFEEGQLTLNFTDKEGNKQVQTLIEGSGELQIRYNVENYTELQSITNQNLYDFAYVRNSEGTTWLPGSLGGSYYGAGLYMWDGNNWTEDDTEIFEQLDSILISLQNLQNNKVDKEDLPKYVSVQAGLTRPGQTTIPLANQQQNIYEKYLELDYSCTVTDNYFISIAFQWSTNIGNTNALFRLALTDGTTTQFQEFSIEAKDTAGQGEVVDVIEGGVIVGSVNTSTDIRVPEYFPVDVILEEGKNYSVSLEFTHQGNAARTTIYSATIRLEQKTQNP